MAAIEHTELLDRESQSMRSGGTRYVDCREAPSYSIQEAAHYVGLSAQTLRAWVYGRSYQSAGGAFVSSRPLISPPEEGVQRLSFYNLVEAHILKGTRQRDEVSINAIRDALDYVSLANPGPHPLITGKFLTDGVYLFQAKLADLVNASLNGQLAFADLMLPYLERIDRDGAGAPLAVFPFVPNKPASRAVTIRSGVSSGVPTITGTGISIPILYGRYEAGDSVSDLADDYDLEVAQVQDAIEYYKAA